MRARLQKRQKLILEEGAGEPSSSSAIDRGTCFSAASSSLSMPSTVAAGVDPPFPSCPSTVLASGLEGISLSSSSPSPNTTVTLAASPDDGIGLAVMDAPCSPLISLQRPSSESLGASLTAVSSAGLGVHPRVPVSPLTSSFSFEADI